MEVYIKPEKKIIVYEKQEVNLKDIAEIFSSHEDIKNQIANEKILIIKDKTKKNYLITITDIIKVIKNKFPDLLVINLGEINTIIEYSPKKTKNNLFFEIARVVFVCLVLFMGAATAIMSFHSDAQIAEIFKNYHKIFFGYELENPKIIAVPYSIGLASGIIIFFNHIFSKKITDDPTPIEVEMALYENNIFDTNVSSLQAQKNNKKQK